MPDPVSVAPSPHAAPEWLHGLRHNLRTALPALAFRRVRLTHFRASVEQAISLFVLLAGFYIVYGFLLVGWPSTFNARALPSQLATDALLLVLLAVGARIAGKSPLALPLFVGLQSTWAWLTLCHVALQFAQTLAPEATWFASLATLLLIWAYLVSTVTLIRWLWGRWLQRLGASAMLHAMLYLSAGYFGTVPLWSAQQAPSTPPAVTEESVLATQPQVLQRALSALLPQRPGIDDLYFVAFAGDAGANVFMYEAQAAQNAFDRHLHSRGRSVSLINNDRTVRETPIATLSNLQTTLHRIGALIDKDNDLVAAYLTTHGSEDHELSVAYPPLQLQQITPAALGAALDHAGIRWRILILSACYAGGFIEPLKNEHTLIVTAADAQHPSFGCGADSDMTYFGRAFVLNALPTSQSLTQAFAQAREEITAREKQEGEEPSNPQLFVGSAIAEKLAKWPANLSAHRSGAGTAAGRHIANAQ